MKIDLLALKSTTNMMRVADSNFDRLQARNATTAKNLSQMDRIIESMTMGGTPSVSEEAKLEAVAARARDLKEVRAKLMRLTIVMSKLYTAPKPDKLKKLTAARKAVQQIIDDKPPVGVAKPLRACVNELTSLREGVFIGAVSDRKALTLLTVQATIEHVDDLIKKCEARSTNIKAQLAVNAGSGMDEGDVDKVIRRNAKESAKMPNLANKDYGVVRAAVVPVLTKFFPPERLIDSLKHMGFSVDNMAGYPAIHNQLLIGVNVPRIQKEAYRIVEEKKRLDEEKKAREAEEKEKRKGKRRVKVKIEPDNEYAEDAEYSWGNLKPLEIAKQVAEMLEKHMGTPLIFGTDVPTPYKGVSWYWVVPAREMNRLAKAFPGGHLQVREWGFAF